MQAADDFSDDGNETYATESDALQSPTKPPATSQEKQLDDLVASARRERKVQDLEITNASLEAINRTLERQLRKQTAELRRYRRLSRSGRLSLGASLMSAGDHDRIASDSSADGGALARAGLMLEDLSEEDSELEGEEDDDDLDEDDEDDYDDDASMGTGSGSGRLSPQSRAARGIRQRKRDERRLQLDLSKHRQLLVDSQKMNQSLKRCLGWTEELIKEGRRALLYQVRVSDVEMGGRVLAPEEVEEREHETQPDDEDIHDGDDHDEEDDTIHGASLVLPTDGTTSQWSKEPQDRDSGIELVGDAG
jgi:hypothetical protein